VGLLPKQSNILGKKELRSAAARLTALLAAVLPEVVREGSEGGVVGGVEVEGAFRASRRYARVDEALQVMAECRGRKVDVGLDVTRGGAFRAGLHDVPENLEPDRMSESTELLGVAFELRGHGIFLIFSNIRGKWVPVNRGSLRTPPVDSNGVDEVVPRAWGGKVRSMFAVLYRFKLAPDTELTFREAWRAGTHAIRALYGTSGSRLHRADDGDLVAYAVWPDRATWEKAQSLPSASPESGATMRACMVGPVITTPLDVLDDLLATEAR
jgi:hypothetical protein